MEVNEAMKPMSYCLCNKTKQEIQGLNFNLKTTYNYMGNYIKFCENAIEKRNKVINQLQKENAELEARLEKSVELPCEMGDKIYFSSCFMSGILIGEVKEIIFDKWGYKINVDGRVFTNRELNIKFFFDKEKAEQALKEREK